MFFNFAIITFLFSLLHLRYVSGTVIGVDEFNFTRDFDDLEATFGTTLGEDGLTGLLVLADPLDGCTPVKPPPEIIDPLYRNMGFVLLVKRGRCDFGLKVLNAQNASYQAAVVYNNLSDELLYMRTSSSSVSKQIVIPSVFVGLSDGEILQNLYLYQSIPNFDHQPYVMLVKNPDEFSLKYYLIPFCAVIGTCFFCLLIFVLLRFAQNRRRQRRNRLSRQRLKQLPVKQYSKGEGLVLGSTNLLGVGAPNVLYKLHEFQPHGDEYDVCAICLDEYEEGEKLRILPCQHAYHCKCVDPWLTSSKRVCPLCKRRVLSDDESTNSDEDDDDDETTSEDAPLLSNSTAISPNASRFATGFNRVNPFTRTYSTSTEEEEEPASLRSIAMPKSPHDWPNPAAGDVGTSQQTPEFFSAYENTPNQLVVLADVSKTPESLSSLPRSSVGSSATDSFESPSSSTVIESDTDDSSDDETQVLILHGSNGNSAVDTDRRSADA